MNSLIPKKPSPASTRTNSPRHAPAMAKASPVEVLSTQQSPVKSNKARSAKRSSAPAKQTETQTADESSPAQKKKTHRSPRKALSTGSLAEMKTSKVLSQESVHILKRDEVFDPSTFFAEPNTTTAPLNNARPNPFDRNHHHRNNNNNNHKEQSHSRDPSPSFRRNIQPPSKSRRTQRRKEVEAITEAIQNSDADMLFGTSPPSPHNSNYNTSSGYSSDEVVMINGTEKVVTVSKTDIKKRRNKRERVVSSPPTTTSAAAFPPLAAPTAEEPKISAPKVTFAKPVQQLRRGSSPAIEIRHHAPSVAFPSVTPFDDYSIKAPRTPPPSIPQAQSKASPLYAGPTFSNSPAPAALPIPSFYSRSLSDSSPISSGNFRPNSQPTTPTRQRTTSATSFLAQHQPRTVFEMDEDVFKMDSVTDLSSSKYNQSSHGRDLLELLSASVTGHKTAPPSVSFVNARIPAPPALQNYHLPPRMMTSHPLQARNTHEMTMNLRSLLKIE